MAFLKELFALFLLIVAIVAVKPEIISDIYDTILGRIVLIAIILFFTIHHATLGLLVALCLIVASNQFFGANRMMIEGNTNMLTNETENNEEEEEEEQVTPSRNDEALKPVDSNTLPVVKEAFSSIEVKPLDGFSSQYSTV
jgi:hypothetical protein